MKAIAAAVFVACACAAGVAGAEPTCGQARELKLAFSPKRSEGQLVFIAAKCPLPEKCTSGSVASGTLVTKRPLTLSVKKKGTTIFEMQLDACDGEQCSSENAGGCPGGGDVHLTSAGSFRWVFPKEGSGVTARVRGPMKSPPPDSGPVTLTVSDANGYRVEATFPRCKRTKTSMTETLVCR